MFGRFAGGLPGLTLNSMSPVERPAAEILIEMAAAEALLRRS